MLLKVGKRHLADRYGTMTKDTSMAYSTRKKKRNLFPSSSFEREMVFVLLAKSSTTSKLPKQYTTQVIVFLTENIQQKRLAMQWQQVYKRLIFYIYAEQSTMLHRLLL